MIIIKWEFVKTEVIGHVVDGVAEANFLVSVPFCVKALNMNIFGGIHDVVSL